MRRGTDEFTLCENPLMRTLFLASSHMSQELSFHTWVAMLYSSMRGSWAQTDTQRTMSALSFLCTLDSDKCPSYWPWWSGTEEDHQWTERSWGPWTGTLAVGCDGNWGTGCYYSVVTWRCQPEPGSKDTVAPGPDGYQTERKHETQINHEPACTVIPSVKAKWDPAVCISLYASQNIMQSYSVQFTTKNDHGL